MNPEHELTKMYRKTLLFIKFQVSLWKFPDFSRCLMKFPDYSRFSRLVDTMKNSFFMTPKSIFMTIHTRGHPVAGSNHNGKEEFKEDGHSLR